MPAITWEIIQGMIDDNNNPNAQVVWNAAIDAAVKLCIDQIDDEFYIYRSLFEELEKLKK